MDEVTLEQVKAVVKQCNITRWTPRSCGICQTPLYYIFKNDMPYYNANCDCTAYPSITTSRLWSDVVYFFNKQTPENRQKLWDSFIGSGANG